MFFFFFCFFFIVCFGAISIAIFFFKPLLFKIRTFILSNFSLFFLNIKLCFFMLLFTVFLIFSLFYILNLWVIPFSVCNRIGLFCLVWFFAFTLTFDDLYSFRFLLYDPLYDEDLFPPADDIFSATFMNDYSDTEAFNSIIDPTHPDGPPGMETFAPIFAQMDDDIDLSYVAEDDYLEGIFDEFLEDTYHFSLLYPTSAIFYKSFQHPTELVDFQLSTRNLLYMRTLDFFQDHNLLTKSILKHFLYSRLDMVKYPLLYSQILRSQCPVSKNVELTSLASEIYQTNFSSNLNALIWLLLGGGGFPFFLSRSEKFSLNVFEWEMFADDDLSLDFVELEHRQQIFIPVGYESFHLFKFGVFFDMNLLPTFDFYFHTNFRERDDMPFVRTFEEAEIKKRTMSPHLDVWHFRENLREYLSNYAPWWRGYFLAGAIPASTSFFDTMLDDLSLRVVHNKLRFGSCVNLITFFNLNDTRNLLLTQASIKLTSRQLDENLHTKLVRTPGLICLPYRPITFLKSVFMKRKSLPLFVLKPAGFAFIDVKSLFVAPVEDKRPHSRLSKFLYKAPGSPQFYRRTRALIQPFFSFFIPYQFSFILPNTKYTAHLHPSSVGIPFFSSHLRRFSDPFRVRNRIISFFDNLNNAIARTNETITDKDSPYFGKPYPFEFSRHNLRHRLREDSFFLESVDFEDDSFSTLDTDFDTVGYVTRSDFLYNLTLSNVLEHNRVRRRWIKGRSKTFTVRFFVPKTGKKGRRVFLTKGRWLFGFTFPKLRIRRRNKNKRFPVFFTRILKNHLKRLLESLISLQSLQIPFILFDILYVLLWKKKPSRRFFRNSVFKLVPLTHIFPVLIYVTVIFYTTLLGLFRQVILTPFFKSYRFNKVRRRVFKWKNINAFGWLPLHFDFGKSLMFHQRLRFTNITDIFFDYDEEFFDELLFRSLTLPSFDNELQRSLWELFYLIGNNLTRKSKSTLKYSPWVIVIIFNSFRLLFSRPRVIVRILNSLIRLLFLLGLRFLFFLIGLLVLFFYVCVFYIFQFLSLFWVDSYISSKFHTISQFTNFILLSKLRFIFNTRTWRFLRSRTVNNSKFYNLFFKPENKTNTAFEQNVRNILTTYDKPFFSSILNIDSSFFVNINTIQPNIEASYASDLFVLSLLSALNYRQSRQPRLYRIGLNPSASFEFLPAYFNKRVLDTDLFFNSLSSGFVLLHESYEVLDHFDDELPIRLLLDTLGQEFMHSLYTINFDTDPFVMLSHYHNLNNSAFAVRPLQLLSDLEDFNIYSFDGGDDMVSEDDIYYNHIDILNFFNFLYDPEELSHLGENSEMLTTVASFVLSNDLQLLLSFPYSLSALELVDEDFWVEDLHILDDEIYSQLEMFNFNFVLQFLDINDLWETADDGEYFYVDELVLYKHSWIFFIFLAHFSFCHLIGDSHHYYSWMADLGLGKTRSSLGLTLYSAYYDPEGVDNIAEPMEQDYILLEEEFEPDLCSEFGLQEDPLTRFYEFLEPFEDPDYDVDTWDLFYELPKMLFTDFPYDLTDRTNLWHLFNNASQHNYFTDASTFHYQHELLPLNRSLCAFSNKFNSEIGSNRPSYALPNISASTVSKLLAYLNYNVYSTHSTIPKRKNLYEFSLNQKKNDAHFVSNLFYFIIQYFPNCQLQHTIIPNISIIKPLDHTFSPDYFSDHFTPQLFVKLYFGLYRFSRLNFLGDLFFQIPFDSLFHTIRNLCLSHSNLIFAIRCYSDPHNLIDLNSFNAIQTQELLMFLRNLVYSSNDYVQSDFSLLKTPLFKSKKYLLEFIQFNKDSLFKNFLYLRNNNLFNKFTVSLATSESNLHFFKKRNPSFNFLDIYKHIYPFYSTFKLHQKLSVFPFFSNLFPFYLHSFPYITVRYQRDDDYSLLFTEKQKLASFLNSAINLWSKSKKNLSRRLVNKPPRPMKNNLASKDMTFFDFKNPLMFKSRQNNIQQSSHLYPDDPIDLELFFIDVNNFVNGLNTFKFEPLDSLLLKKKNFLRYIHDWSFRRYRRNIFNLKFLDTRITEALVPTKDTTSFIFKFFQKPTENKHDFSQYNSFLEEDVHEFMSIRRLFEFPLKMNYKYKRGPLIGSRLHAYRNSIELLDRSREISQELIRQGLHNLTTLGPELFFYKNDPYLFEFLKEYQSLFLFDFLQAYNTFYSYLGSYPRQQGSHLYQKGVETESYLNITGVTNLGYSYVFSEFPESFTSSGYKFRYNYANNFKFNMVFDFLKGIKNVRVYDFLFTQYVNTFIEDDMASYLNSDGIFEVFTDETDDIISEDDALFTTYSGESVNFEIEPLVDYDPDTINLYVDAEFKELLISRQLDEHGSFEREPTFQTLYWSLIDYSHDELAESGERIEKQVDDRADMLAFPEELFTSSTNFPDDISLTFDFDSHWRRFKGDLGAATFSQILHNMQKTPIEDYPVEIADIADEQFWDFIFDPNNALMYSSIFPKITSSLQRAHGANLNVHVDQWAWAAADNNLELDMHPMLSNYNFIDRPLFRFLRGQDPTYFEDVFGLKFSSFFFNNLYDFWHIGGYDSYPSFSTHLHNKLHPNLFFSSNPFLTLPLSLSSKLTHINRPIISDLHDFSTPLGLEKFDKDNKLLRSVETFDLNRNLLGFSSDEFLNNISLGDFISPLEDREFVWDAQDRKFFDAHAFSDDLLSDFRSTPAWPFFLFSRLSSLGNFTPPTVQLNNFGLTLLNEAYSDDIDESEEGSDEFDSETQDETERESLAESLGEGFYTLFLSLEDASDISDYLLPGLHSDMTNPSTFSFREFFRIFRVITKESLLYWSARWSLHKKNLARLALFIDNYETKSFRLYFKYFFQKYIITFWLLFLQLLSFLIQFLQVFFVWVKSYFFQCIDFVFVTRHNDTTFHLNWFKKPVQSAELHKFLSFLDNYSGFTMFKFYETGYKPAPLRGVIWTLPDDKFVQFFNLESNIFLFFIDSCLAYGAFFFAFLAVIELSSFYLTNDLLFGSTDEDSYYVDEQYSHELFKREMGSLDGNIAYQRSALFGTLEQTSSDISPITSTLFTTLNHPHVPTAQFYARSHFKINPEYHTNIQHFFSISDLQHWFPDLDDDSDDGFEEDVLMDEEYSDDLVESHASWDLSDFFHQMEATREVLLGHFEDPFLVYSFDESRIGGNFEELILYASSASGFLYTFDPIDIFLWNLSRKQLLLFAETLFIKLRQFSIGLHNISALVPDNHSLLQALTTFTGFSPFEGVLPEKSWVLAGWKEYFIDPTAGNFYPTDLWNLRASSWSRALGWSDFSWYSQIEQLSDNNYYSSLFLDSSLNTFDTFGFLSYSNILNHSTEKVRIFFVDCFWSLIQDRLEINRRIFYSKLSNKIDANNRILVENKVNKFRPILLNYLSRPDPGDLFFSHNFAPGEPEEDQSILKSASNRTFYQTNILNRKSTLANTLLNLHKKSIRADIHARASELSTSLAKTTPVPEILLPFLKRLEISFPKHYNKIRAFKGQYFGHLKHSPYFEKAWQFLPDTFEQFARNPLIWPIFQTFFPKELERFSQLTNMNHVTLTVFRDDLIDFFFLFFDYFLYCYATDWIHDLSFRSFDNLYMSPMETESLHVQTSTKNFWKWWSFCDSSICYPFGLDLHLNCLTFDRYCSSHFGAPKPLLIGEFNFGSYLLFDRLPCTISDLNTLPETLFQDLLDLETIFKRFQYTNLISPNLKFLSLISNLSLCDLAVLPGICDDDLGLQPLQQRLFLSEYIIWLLFYQNDLDEDFLEIMHNFAELDSTKIPPYSYRQISPIRRLPYWPDIQFANERFFVPPSWDFSQIRSRTASYTLTDGSNPFIQFRNKVEERNHLWLKFFGPTDCEFRTHLNKLLATEAKEPLIMFDNKIAVNTAQSLHYETHFNKLNAPYKTYPFYKRVSQKTSRIRVLSPFHFLQNFIMVPYFRLLIGIPPIEDPDNKLKLPVDDMLKGADAWDIVSIRRARRDATFHPKFYEKMLYHWTWLKFLRKQIHRYWLTKRFYITTLFFFKSHNLSLNSDYPKWLKHYKFLIFYFFFRYKFRKIFKFKRRAGVRVRYLADRKMGRRFKYHRRFHKLSRTISTWGLRGEAHFPFRSKLIYIYSRLFQLRNLPLVYLELLSNLDFYIQHLLQQNNFDIFKTEQHMFGQRLITDLNLKFFDDLDSWAAFENKFFWHQADLLSGFFEDFFLSKFIPFTSTSFSGLSNLARNSSNLYLDSFSLESQDSYTRENLSQSLLSLYPRELNSFHNTQYFSGDLDFDYTRLHYNSWSDLFNFDLAYSPSIFYTLSLDTPFSRSFDYLLNDDIVWLCKMQMLNWKWVEDPSSSTLFESRILQYRLTLISAANMRLYFNFYLNCMQFSAFSNTKNFLLVKLVSYVTAQFYLCLTKILFWF